MTFAAAGPTVAGMCRTGGRRCPGCAGETARAAHNARRRRNREIKREILAHAEAVVEDRQRLDALRGYPPARLKEWAAEQGLPEHLHPGRGHTAPPAPAAAAEELPGNPPADVPPGIGVDTLLGMIVPGGREGLEQLRRRAPGDPVPGAAPGRGRGGGGGGGDQPAGGEPPAPRNRVEEIRAGEARWRTPALERQVAQTMARQGQHRDEKNLLGAEEAGRRGAMGGSNETREVKLTNGITGYHKPFAGLNDQVAETFGHTSAQQPVHEVAAWQLARELGPPWDQIVPPVVLRSFDGRMGSFALERPGQALRTDLSTIDAGEIRAAAFFDSLIGQQDRHRGNYLAAGDRLTLIDHGYAFARPDDYCNYSDLTAHRARSPERTKRLTGAEIDALDRLLDSPDTCGLEGILEPERLTALRDRAEVMRRRGKILDRGNY